MGPDNRALLTLILAVVVGTAAFGAYMLAMPRAPPDSLPVLAGSVFMPADASAWAAHFQVGAAGGVLVGAWTAYNATPSIGLEVVNGTVSRPPDVYACPMIAWQFAERNGTVDVALAPGAYTVYWNTYCAAFSRIVVTRSLEVVPAGSLLA